MLRKIASQKNSDGATKSVVGTQADAFFLSFDLPSTQSSPTITSI
jgi:hypothetical protein